MTSDQQPSIAEYLAVLLVNMADEYQRGLSAKIDYVRALPEKQFRLDMPDGVVDDALDILRRCGIAAISKDPLAGEFVAIKAGSFNEFMGRVQKDLDEYDNIVRGAPDENAGIGRAEEQSYKHLDLLNRYEPLKSYSRFGDTWAYEVLERLRTTDPVEAISEGFPISSAAWTGIEKKIDAAKLSEIKKRVANLRSAVEQSDLSEKSKANALCRIDAVESLLEAPDPPWKLIVELFNNPVLTGFLNIAAIMTLIFGN